jgi:outer membrane protein assembly factor BamA
VHGSIAVRSRISVAAMDANSVVNITKVIVAGNHRTELSYYQPELSEVCRPGQTLQQVTNELCKARDNLVSTDYFDDVDLNLTVSPSGRGPNDCVLKVNVKEKQILRLKIGGQTGNDEPTGAVLELGLRTPLGFGEELTFSYVQSIAQELTAAVSMRNVGPQKLDMKIKGRSFRESYPFTSVDHQLDAVSVVLNSRDHIHQVTAEYALRDEIPITNPAPRLLAGVVFPASAAVRNTAAPSLKTSLRYLFTSLNTLDDFVNPSKGAFLQSSVEMAAPPGSFHGAAC